ncbi:hypothetical protein [Shinella zoogloeoides]|uniref:hypothetical protein n=1 Tax=Shinella zoogloeoides TaxID=352475 RepID=UPI001F597B3D|nr:hypothetical protein [Shinella zoogloeoides]
MPKLTEFEETFIRATTLLDDPNAPALRSEIASHLDTMIDYAADDDQRRIALQFKALALNHVDSIGRDRPDVTETKRIRALEYSRQVTFSIESRR